MIAEDYVSFEVAKLLKEKGFECEKDSVTAMYNEVGMFLSLSTAAEYYYDYSDFDEYDYVAPTIQMAMKWLRETHNLYMYTAFAGMEEVWFSRIYNKDKHLKDLDGLNTYEEACEAAVRYCLENLI